MFAPTAKLLEKILSAKPEVNENDNGAPWKDTHWLAVELERLRNIEENEYAFCREERKAEEALAQKRKEIGQKRKANQSRCPHYNTTFHPDAAGGSDSFTRCNTCQAEL